MGVRASFLEISAELFEQIVAGGEPELPREPRQCIDKAWNDFHAVFKAKGSPLCLAISGDHRHSLSPHTLDQFCEGHHEYYFGFASPDLVRQIANALFDVSSSDYKAWEVVLVGDCYNIGQVFFPNLKAAYLEAAAHHNALMILIA